MPLKSCGSVSERLSVWFSAASCAANSAAVQSHDVDAAGVHARPTRRAPRDEVQRRAALRAGFGQRKRAAVELEAASAVFAGGLPPRACQCSRPAIIR